MAPRKDKDTAKQADAEPAAFPDAAKKRPPIRKVKAKAEEKPADQPVSEAPEAAAPVAETAAPEAVAEEAGKVKRKAKKEKAKDKGKKKRKKEAVVMRFEMAQLAAIDARAEGLGLSRAAWVRMVVAKELE